MVLCGLALCVFRQMAAQCVGTGSTDVCALWGTRKHQHLLVITFTIIDRF